MNDLPRRPVQPLAAPPNAFDVVTRRAKARRTRTGLLAAGLGLAVAATGVVAAMPSATAPKHRIEPADRTHSAEPEPTAAIETSPTPSPSASPSVAAEDPDVVAGRIFIEAWRQRDAAGMRKVAYPNEDADVVEAALEGGTPQGSATCTTQRNGQYQCVVSVAEDKQMYILVGDPDDRLGGPDRTGFVVWVGWVTM